MKRILLFGFVCVVVVLALLVAYWTTSKERMEEAEAEKPVTAPSRVERRANGTVAVTLDADTQKRIGLATTPVVATNLVGELRAFGRVLDPTPLESLRAELASADAALAASSKEFQRVRQLHADNQNASARALETAEAAMKRDQVAVETARFRLVTAWGKAVADLPDLDRFVRSLAARDIVLVRLDLPRDEWLNTDPVGARLALPGTNGFVAARFLGRAPGTDPQVQGQGFLLIVTNPPGWLAQGLAVTGFLQLAGEPLRGVFVPEAAVVRSAGLAWVYVQTSPTVFTRRQIDVEHPATDGWVVTTLAPSDRLVTTNAQTLLSEEFKTQIKMGD